MAGKGTKRRQNNMLTRVKRSIKRAESGHPLRGRSDPPRYVGCPWWPLTVVTKAAATTNITVASIWTLIFKQITGIPSTAKGYIRMVSIRCWGLDKTHLNLTVHDPVTGDVIDDLYDWAGDVAFSHTGYSYGRISSEKPLIYTKTTQVAQVVVPTDKNALVYINVLVRFNTGEPADRLKLSDLVLNDEHEPYGFDMAE